MIRQKQKKSIYVIFSSFYYPCEFSVRSVCWLDFLCLKFLSYISLFRWEMRALLLPVQTKVFFLAKRNTQYGSRNVAINKRLITLTPASWYKQLNVYLPEKNTMSNSIFISSITVFFFSSWNPALIILITSLSFSLNIRKTPFCSSCHQCVYNRLLFVSVCTQ